MMEFEEKVVNWNKAHELLQSTHDVVEQKLLNIALAQVVKAFIQADNETNQDIQTRIPVEPFDAFFYLKLVQGIFHNKLGIIALLEGDVTALDDFKVE